MQSRQLACILCAQRKIKCDRNLPCSNCRRSGAQCVPSALQSRQRKKRFPERDLLNRLRDYESLLRKHDIAFEPLHPGGGGEGANAEAKVESVSAASPASASASAGTPMEQKFEAKDFWTAMSGNFHTGNSDSDEASDGDTINEETVRSMLDNFHDQSDRLLFGSYTASIELADLHPDIVHVFRLWQIYSDNVDPLLKITHGPSTQSQILEAATDWNKVKSSSHALLFSIYCMAIQSTSDDLCVSTFGASKQEMLIKFHFACEQALLRSKFLRTTNRECLTALLLYLMSLEHDTDPRGLSSMLAIALRVAERMAMNSEKANCAAGPFEAEMRRRLWWSLVIFDARVSELSNHKTSSLLPVWDCKPPSNVSDSELRPGMAQPPSTRLEPTEAIFAVVRGELCNYFRFSTLHLDFTNPALKGVVQRDESSHVNELTQLETYMQSKYLQRLDEQNPLHYLSLWFVRGMCARYRLVDFYSRCASNWAANQTAPTDKERDEALYHAISVLDCDTRMISSPATRGYLWIANYNFPFVAHVQVAQDLRKRASSSYSERAWQAMDDNYTARFSSVYQEELPYHRIFGAVILAAWGAYEERLRKEGREPKVPRMVVAMKQALPAKPVTGWDTSKHNPGMVNMPEERSSGMGAMDISNTFAPMSMALFDPFGSICDPAWAMSEPLLDVSKLGIPVADSGSQPRFDLWMDSSMTQ